MRSALLVAVAIIQLVRALSSADEATGFSAAPTSPLLLGDSGLFCKADIRSHDAAAAAAAAAVVVVAPGEHNETGWIGPRDCVRQFCIYAHRRIAGGLVVITDAPNAARIATLLSEEDAHDLHNNNEEEEGGQQPPPAFYATEVPGKGIGLVANRTIRRGERIMRWLPTYMMHRTLPDALAPKEQERLLDAALAQLPAVRREAFLRQLGQFGGHRVSDIMLTNAFQMDVPLITHPHHHEEADADAGHHLGNFPDVSRFNHDCRPNVAFHIDAHLTHHTHAARDIVAGEELTLSYLNPLETHAVRQAHIRGAWGFTCTCAQCAASPAAIAASDARLWELDAVEAVLGDVQSPEASVDLVRRLLALYEAERLDVKMHGAYVLAALNYNLLGHADKAREYAERAVAAGIVEFGPEADDVQAMRALAADPKGHFTWRKRVGG